jgi:hypothetical protein
MISKMYENLNVDTWYHAISKTEKRGLRKTGKKGIPFDGDFWPEM